MRPGGVPVSRGIDAGAAVTIAPRTLHPLLAAGHGATVPLDADAPALVRTRAHELGPDRELLRFPQDGNEELRSQFAAL